MNNAANLHLSSFILRPAPARLGILNVTPDSFSDGGSLRSRSDRVRLRMERMVAFIDAAGSRRDPIGGCQCRAGLRVVPVIEGIARSTSRFVDTRKSRVAKAALDANATHQRRERARHDPEMRTLAAQRGVPVILARAASRRRAENIQYDDVVEDVMRELREWRDSMARDCGGPDPRRSGIARENVRSQPRAPRALREFRASLPW
jgi:dihydropteroate synthase